MPSVLRTTVLNEYLLDYLYKMISKIPLITILLSLTDWEGRPAELL